MNAGPEQGWYTNPENSSEVRWWDGNAWTDHTERNPMAVPAVAQIPGGSVPPPPLVPPSSVTARDFSGWFNELFRLVWARIGHLFTLGAIFSLLPSLLQGLAMYLVFRDAELRIDYLTDEVDYTGPGVAGFMVIAVVIIAAVVATLVLYCAICRQIHLEGENEPEPWSASVLPALKRTPRLLGSMFLLGLVCMGVMLLGLVVVLVSAALTPALLLITIPLYIFVLFVALLRLAFAPVIAAIGPKGYGSIRKSIEVSKGHTMAMLGRLALLTVVSWIISIAVSSAFQGSGGVVPIGAGVTEDVVLNFEMLYGSNPAAFMLLMALTPIINTMSTSVMLAGLLVMYKDFGGEVGLRRLGSGDRVSEIAEGFDTFKPSPSIDGTSEDGSPSSWNTDQ